MTEQGTNEPTGCAKITPAFCLPCKFVLHTVGPIYDASVDQSGGDCVWLTHHTHSW